MPIILSVALFVLCPICAALAASLWVERQLTKALRERVAVLEHRTFFRFKGEKDGEEHFTYVPTSAMIHG